MSELHVKHALTPHIYRHMPSHLDILVGDYRRAIDANTDACLADEKYVAEHGARNFYSFYMMHNYHSLIYAAMFAGQFKVALDTVNRMEASLPDSLLRIESPPMADWLENFASVRVHVLVRFGRWEDLIALDAVGQDSLLCDYSNVALWQRRCICRYRRCRKGAKGTRRLV
jgi:hypothetical protein